MARYRLQHDLTGRTFNMLTALEYIGAGEWKCQCLCGEMTNVRTGRLLSGHTKSCGCKRLAIGQESPNFKHGMSLKSSTATVQEGKTYRSWASAKHRCENPADPNFHHYGGRGIKMCAEWSADFRNFLKDMGVMPEGYSIERVDVNGDYCTENCKWIPRKEQTKNLRTSRRFYWKGEMRCVAEIVRMEGIDRSTLDARLKAGWEFCDAMELLLKKKAKKEAKKKGGQQI